VKLATTDGVPLLDDTVLFSAHGVPVVRVPDDRGVIVAMEGFSNELAVLWKGSAILPPSSRDTTYQILLSAVESLDTSNSVSNGPASAPIFDSASVPAWAPNTYDQAVRVYLSSSTPGSTIHYTLDGSFPTTASPAYADTGILVDSNRTLEAVASAPGWTTSTGFVRTFFLASQPAAIGSIDIPSWAANTYDQPVVVTFASVPPGAEIHYTLDGTTPVETSPLASKTLLIDSSRTLNAVVFNGKCLPSQKILTQDFRLQVQPVAIAADGNAGWPPFEIGMSCPTPGSSIRFARQRAIPTLDSASYVDSFAFGKMDDSIVLSAVAFDTAHPKILPSSLAQNAFRWNIPWNTAIRYGTLTDFRDGQSYRTVQVGSQTWMAENLNYDVPTSTCNEMLGDCHDQYGRTYTWSETMGLGTSMDAYASGSSDTDQQGICPTGWHIPNNGEWQTLFANATGSGTAGTALRSATSGAFIEVDGHGVPGNGGFVTPGTDAFGMRVLPAPYYLSSLAGVGENTSARFWTATESGAEGGYVEIDITPSPNMSYDSKSDRIAVRCLEN